MTLPQTRQEAAQQLRLAISASGLSVTRFAREILKRDPRAVRRYVAGECAVPRAVAEWLDTTAGMHILGADMRAMSAQAKQLIAYERLVSDVWGEP